MISLDGSTHRFVATILFSAYQVPSAISARTKIIPIGPESALTIASTKTPIFCVKPSSTFWMKTATDSRIRLIPQSSRPV